MRRIAFTAKPATSRTRRRTSTGWFRKAEEAQITRTCKVPTIALIALAAAAAPANASISQIPNDPASAYVAARAASISGEHAAAAEIYARLASSSTDEDLKQRALHEAISAGDMPLALKLAHQESGAPFSVNAKLLLVSEALKAGDYSQAVKLLGKSPAGGADLSFWAPLVQAWDHAARGDSAGALAVLAQVPHDNAFAPFTDEESAFVLLKLGKADEADAYARRAIVNSDRREFALRLALAGSFDAAGDRQRAQALVNGISGDSADAREALAQGRLKSLAIDSAAKAFADQLLALAVEMQRSDRVPGDPVNVIQIARYDAPDNSAAAVLLGKALEDDGRTADALAAYRSVSDGDPLKGDALDAEAHALTDMSRFDEALSLATRAVQQRGATSDDFARLGDVYSAMKRNDAAAQAYGRAIELSKSIRNARTWPLLLLRASALESAGRWPEAKQVLDSAIALAPKEPLVLNFLGYSKLEHGEDLDGAEALIRQASALDPDDASITDSLGWALYKHGHYDEAVDMLQKAAIGDPAQADIQEHLGDALYASGRRFEARFAWAAALATADDDDTARIKAKIATGLSKATAAP